LVKEPAIVGRIRLTALLVLAVVCLLSEAPGAQQKPDFSGVWVLDPSQSDEGVYGQMRVISQTADWVDMAVLHFAASRTSITPWRLPFNRWRPRRGGDTSLEPVVQTRWDGDRLVTLKAPATHYSVLWVWTLSNDGRELTSEGISTGIGFSFDFKVSSAPRGYVPNRHVYRKAASIHAPDGRAFAVLERGVAWDPPVDQSPVLLRFGADTSALSVTCVARPCTVADIVAGRTRLSQKLAAGSATTVALTANTAIDAKE
jgi:hypothetical protein